MWKDEFEENLAIGYGLFEDSKQNIYLIGLEGLRIYDKNGKLIDINRNIKGYGIYQFNDGYVVFNLRFKEYYEWKKNVLLKHLLFSTLKQKLMLLNMVQDIK